MEHSDVRRCVCGHPREAHEHYRVGTDCGLCGRARCRRFRTAGSLRARLARLLGAAFAVRSRAVVAPAG